MYHELTRCAYCGDALDLSQPGVIVRYQGMTRIVLHGYHVEDYERHRGQIQTSLGLQVAFLLLFLIPSLAFSRPNPVMSCRNLDGTTVRCEAKYVWPEIPIWKAGDKDYGKGYGEGFGMDMKIGEKWTPIQMTVQGQLLTVEARKWNGKAEFRQVPTQVATLP